MWLPVPWSPVSDAGKGTTPSADQIASRRLAVSEWHFIRTFRHATLQTRIESVSREEGDQLRLPCKPVPVAVTVADGLEASHAADRFRRGGVEVVDFQGSTLGPGLLSAGDRTCMPAKGRWGRKVGSTVIVMQQAEVRRRRQVARRVGDRFIHGRVCNSCQGRGGEGGGRT